jgi:hypothetical protein
MAQFVPTPWPMSGGFLANRKAACRQYIEDHWLSDGQFWKLLNLNAAQQDAICRGKAITVNVVYAFKDGDAGGDSESLTLKPNCGCLGVFN